MKMKKKKRKHITKKKKKNYITQEFSSTHPIFSLLCFVVFAFSPTHIIFNRAPGRDPPLQ